MEFYTSEIVGKTRALTPEGFLVCQDVPIARTGTMLYADGETPIRPGPDGLTRINRDAAEVFAPQAMASFLGKPVTNDHPPTNVTPGNWRRYAVGSVQNVRRGEGIEDHLLIADLLITDEEAIEAIQSGKREVSCGYTPGYRETGPGRGEQHDIIGNHVALVERGRCGSMCAIGDTMPDKREPMAVVSSRQNKLALLKSTIDEMMGESASESGSSGQAVHVHMHGKMDEDDDDGVMKKVMEKLDQLTSDVAALKATRDESEKEKEDEDKEEKTKDSSSLSVLHRVTLARAEILSPGIRLPSFDAKDRASVTLDGLCALRKSALAKAYAGEHRDVIGELLAGGKPAFDSMTCDAAGALFNSASMLVERSNNKAPRIATDRREPPARPNADFNKKAAELWKKAS